jgi:hypothetical protein
MRFAVAASVVVLVSACGAKTEQVTVPGVGTVTHISECRPENPNCAKIPEINTSNCTNQNGLAVMEKLGVEAAREFNYQCNAKIWHRF